MTAPAEGEPDDIAGRDAGEGTSGRMLLARDVQPDVQAVADFELAIVPHPQLDHALEALAMLQARSLASRKGRRAKAKGLLVMGRAGAGKTSLIEVWAAANEPYRTEDGLVIPLLVIEVPEFTSKRALVVRIMEAMGYTAGKESAEDILGTIVEKVRLLGVQLIIFDEAHHILGGKDAVAVSEFLKSLLNRVGAGIVFVGLPALEVLAGPEQFDRRLAPDVKLRAYDWTDIPERLEFLVLLEALDAAMDLPERAGLQDQDIARRLYTASRGEIGIVSKYLSQALLLARRRGLRRIDLELLAEVDAAWHPAPAPSNAIAFDADLNLEAEATMAALAVDARRTKIDREANPFLCDGKQLLKLLEARIARPSEFVSPGKRNARRSKGLGLADPKAF